LIVFTEREILKFGLREVGLNEPNNLPRRVPTETHNTIAIIIALD